MTSRLQSIGAGLQRYRLLARSEGLVGASLRAVRFLRRHDAEALGPVLSAWALDPSNPEALTPKAQAARAGATDLAEPPATLNSVRELGVPTAFVVRVTSDDRDALDRSIQSLLDQTEPTWEILLSVRDGVAIDLDDLMDRDWRIRRLPAPMDARHDLIRAAPYATAPYVGLIVQGDTVDRELVKAIAHKAAEQPDVDLVYTDQACLLEDGRLVDRFHKPDWSPEHLTSVNYLGGFLALRKTLLLGAEAGGLAEAEAADYALALTASRHAARIAHLDEALYFTSRPSPGGEGRFPAAALGDAQRVLRDYVRRENAAAEVGEGAAPGTLEVAWPVAAGTPVTLVILTGMRRREVPGRGNIVLAEHFVRSIIERSSFKGYRILLVDDGVVPDDLLKVLKANGHARQAHVADGPFSFARKANFATRLVEDGVVILLNDDMEVIEPDWIQAMAGLALRPRIGAVGARLFYPDGSLQHTGIALGYHGAAGHMLHRARADGSEYGAFASITRNYSAVTGAAMAFRRAVFDEVGGFDERFSIDYNDVDFCLRLGRAGYRVAVTPAASLYHFHNSSLQRTNQDRGERQAFVERWEHEIERDPYFSRHFQRRGDDLPLLASDDEADL
ncbi:MAG TPA: glycosyltransferase [Caulobacteraceae bacterium]|nr:glycosyltransferase [Caulobacteraceae bacterium]